jgi:hypothetical protein
MVVRLLGSFMVRPVQQRGQQGALRVQPVLGLVEHD